MHTIRPKVKTQTRILIKCSKLKATIKMKK